jgi:hypothetical protein
MVSTVANQKLFFSSQEIKAADSAQERCCKIGRPSDESSNTYYKTAIFLDMVWYCITQRALQASSPLQG